MCHFGSPDWEQECSISRLQFCSKTTDKCNISFHGKSTSYLPIYNLMQSSSCFVIESISRYCLSLCLQIVLMCTDRQLITKNKTQRVFLKTDTHHTARLSPEQAGGGRWGGWCRAESWSSRRECRMPAGCTREAVQINTCYGLKFCLLSELSCTDITSPLSFPPFWLTFSLAPCTLSLSICCTQSSSSICCYVSLLSCGVRFQGPAF